MDNALIFRLYGGRTGGQATAFWLGKLGFWGGVDPISGTVIDPLHPRVGLCLAGAVCIIGETKGSTAGPGALLEWIGGASPPLAILSCAPNLTLATVAEAAAFVGGAGTVLGELSGQHCERTLIGWEGAQVTLEANRIVRIGGGRPS